MKREYYEIAVEKANELHHAVTDRLSPTLPQKTRVRVLCDAASQKVVYKNDNTNLCHTTYYALVNGYAVCDEYAALLNVHFRLYEIKCEGRIGYAGGGLHEWTYAEVDGEWINIDATWVDGGQYKYIGLTDDEIAETHTADLSYQSMVAKEALQKQSGVEHKS